MRISHGGPAPAPVVATLPELVEWAARAFGDAPFALRHTPQGWAGHSYAGFARAVRATRVALEERGVRPGFKVGLQSENRPEWGIAYFAILAAGAIAVPLDAQLKEQEAGEILATAGALHAIASARQMPVLAAVQATRVPELDLIALDPAGGGPSLADAGERFADAAPAPRRASPRDLAVIIFTSGTTGQAKGVMLSHENILSNVEAVARTFEFGPGDRFLSVLPLHHTFESTGGLMCPMRVGAAVCYARGLDSKQLREDMRSSRCTLFLGVPLLYEKLLAAVHRGIAEAPAPRRLLARALLGVTRLARLVTGLRLGRALLAPLRERAGLGSIRIFVTGAAPLADEVFFGFIDLGWPVLEGYGLTETSPVVAANRPQRPRPGAVGWPLPGIDVGIADPDGDGNGEILVRGPNVMLGYYANPAATAEVMTDGWFRTGDLGRLLADGRVRITGRLKNMIATAAGKKIYPEEIEAQLANSPWVLEVVVAGGRDARGEREEVHAHVFPNQPALEAHAATLGRACDDAFVEGVIRRDIEARCAALAPYKRVRKVIVRTLEFPKTTTGKIRRQGFHADAAAPTAEGAA